MRTNHAILTQCQIVTGGSATANKSERARWLMSTMQRKVFHRFCLTVYSNGGPSAVRSELDLGALDLGLSEAERIPEDYESSVAALAAIWRGFFPRKLP